MGKQGHVATRELMQHARQFILHAPRERAGSLTVRAGNGCGIGCPARSERLVKRLDLGPLKALPATKVHLREALANLGFSAQVAGQGCGRVPSAGAGAGQDRIKRRRFQVRLDRLGLVVPNRAEPNVQTPNERPHVWGLNLAVSDEPEVGGARHVPTRPVGGLGVAFSHQRRTPGHHGARGRSPTPGAPRRPPAKHFPGRFSGSNVAGNAFGGIFSYTESELEPAVHAEILVESSRNEARVAILEIVLVFGFGAWLGFATETFRAVAIFALLTIVPLLLDASLRSRAAARVMAGQARASQANRPRR